MKFFNKKSASFKELRKQMIMFAATLGVKKVSFNKNGKLVTGTYDTETNSIYVCINQTKKEALRTFFHEMGHHHAVIHNKWVKYHHRKYLSVKCKTIFDIENKIDKIANTLWNKYVDTKKWGRYKYAYPKAEKNSIINNFISKYYE